MLESQFQTVYMAFWLLAPSIFGPSLSMTGFHGNFKVQNHHGHSFFSKKKEGLAGTIAQSLLFITGFPAGQEKKPRMDSYGDKHPTAYLNINYLKTFNPISTYGRLTNVMNANQHNIILRSSGIVTVYSLIELF